MKYILTLLFLLLNILSCFTMEDCWSNHKIPYFYFGVRTNYDFVGNKKGFERNSECEPVSLWMLMRQSVSWPSENVLIRLQTLHRLKESILDNHTKGRGDLCQGDLNRLKETDFPPKTAKAGKLTEQGEKDIQHLSDMLKSAFPDSFEKPYSEDNYQIRYAHLPGVNESAKLFTESVFGSNFDFEKIRKPSEIDISLNGPNICDSWRGKYFHGRYWGLVYFIMMKHSALRKDIARRLGFPKTLPFDVVVLMYIGCGLQKAMYPYDIAAWCTVFTFEQLQLLRYMEDSFYYKACGPGEDMFTPLNKIMTCPLYSDLIAHHSKGVHGRSFQNTFYFTDEKSLLLLLNGLGFLEETKISPVSSAEPRTFRTSSLTPFGANLVSVLYKCSAENIFRVGFYLNGHRFKRPGQQEEMESWEGFKKRMQKQYTTSLLCHADFCPDYITSDSIEDTTFKVFYEF